MLLLTLLRRLLTKSLAADIRHVDCCWLGFVCLCVEGGCRIRGDEWLLEVAVEAVLYTSITKQQLRVTCCERHISQAATTLV